MSTSARPSHEVLDLMRAQSGVVRREQLLDLGITRRTLVRRISEGWWEARGKHVLVFAGTAEGLLTDSLVVAHALAPDGVLTGFSALAVRGELGRQPWDSTPPLGLPWIVHPKPNRLRARTIRGVVPHPHRILGVAVAPPDRVLVDLARLLPIDDARRLVMRVAQSRGSAWTRAQLEGGAGLGPGFLGARQVADLVTSLGTGAHSDAENLLVTLLHEAGITGFLVNHPVRIGDRVARIDIAFPQARLAIEVDGRAYHSGAERFQNDRTRQNRLVARGWRVLRFTWADLTERPERVVAEILGMLAMSA